MWGKGYNMHVLLEILIALKWSVVIASVVFTLAQACLWGTGYLLAKTESVHTDAEILEHVRVRAFFIDIESIMTSPFPASFEFPTLRIKITIPYTGDMAVVHQQGHAPRQACPSLLDALTTIAYNQHSHSPRAAQ